MRRRIIAGRPVQYKVCEPTGKPGLADVWMISVLVVVVMVIAVFAWSFGA